MIVGMLSDRRHTRLISEFGGLKAVMPRFVAAFLLITLSSIALPGMNGFVGEFLILLGGFLWNPKFAAFAATGVILSAVYMLWMFQRVNYGELTNAKNRALPDLTPREWALMVPTIAMAIVMGVVPGRVPASDGAGGQDDDRARHRPQLCGNASDHAIRDSRASVASRSERGDPRRADCDPDPEPGSREPRSQRGATTMTEYARPHPDRHRRALGRCGHAGRSVPAARRAHADRRPRPHRPGRRGDRIRRRSGTATRTASASSAPTTSRSSSTSSSASSAS